MIDYENLPYHESMRRKRDPFDDYYRWDKESYTWIIRMIENFIGKKFNDVYHKVCKKFTKEKYWKAKRYFLNLFEYRYKVDEDGIIRRNHVYVKPRRSVLIPITEYPIIYRINRPLGQHLSSYICSFLNNYDQWRFKTRSADPRLGEKVKCLIENYFGKTLDNKTLSYYLNIEDPNEYKRYYEGSPEYAKYTHEQDSKRRKKAREYAKQLKEYKSNLLNYVEAERKRNNLGEDTQLYKDES